MMHTYTCYLFGCIW